MGRYSELVLNCRLVKDVGESVIDALQLLLAAPSKEETTWISYLEVKDETAFLQPEEWEKLEENVKRAFNHPLFHLEIGSVAGILKCAHSVGWGKALSALYFKDWEQQYFLSVRTNMKNGDWIYELFIDWLAYFADTEGFVGYINGEEGDEPVLIYFREGDAFLRNTEPISVREKSHLQRYFQPKNKNDKAEGQEEKELDR